MKKINWKKIISVGLVVLTIMGVCSGIAFLGTRETKTIPASGFSVGAIDSEGEYVKSSTSIYTKDFIECQGLEIEPDFEATGTFEVFYYDSEKEFIASTGKLDKIYKRDEAYPLAKYCKIMITPEVPEDEDGFPVDDFEIKWHSVRKYAKMYTITVDKEQNFELPNLFVKDKNMIGKAYSATVGNPLEVQSGEEYAEFGCIKAVDVTNIDKILIEYHDDQEKGMYNYFFLDAEGKVVGGFNDEGAMTYTEIVVPETAATFVCSFKLGHEFALRIG